ncbi:MAG: radical SAM protein [Thermoguttaceae bacterium]
MRIALIRPNMADVRSSDAMHPLCFAVLASLTPANIELELFDECLEPIRYDRPADLVAMTVETYTARNAYQIAAKFHRRGVPVVMGGHHPTLLPDEALRHADAVVVGDAEGIWQELVRDAQSGNLRRVYRQPAMPSLAGAMPKRDIFRGKRYAPLDLVQFGRGCRFACDFCSIHAFYGASLRWRPVDEVVAEIESLGGRHLLFVDDNLMADVARAEELFRALAPLRIRWSCQTSIDVCREPRLLKLMADSGCQIMLIGFESLDQRNLQQMKKQWAFQGGDYATSIRKLHDCGIMIYGTFVFGYDCDTIDSFQASVDFALQSRFFLANFNPLMPTPGTALYQRLQAEGRLLHDRWWLAPEFRYGQAVFRPRRMTPEQLAEGCYRARRAFNTYRSIFRRALDWRTNCRSPRRLGAFLLGNFVSRREILKKQGMTLGGDGLPSSEE